MNPDRATNPADAARSADGQPITVYFEEPPSNVIPTAQQQLRTLDCQHRQASAQWKTERTQLKAELKSALGRYQHQIQLRQEAMESARYQIGDAMINALSSPMGLLKLPLKLWNLYRAKKRAQPLGPSDAIINNPLNKRVLREFHQFVEFVQQSGAKYFVVMFSGTTYIQDIRANRPIRLTRCLLKDDVPVLFNFHRWKATDHVPAYNKENPYLFQSPIDLTPALVYKLLQEKLPERKLFVASYPHPSVPQLINRLNTHGWATLYDCRDDWEEFSKVGAAKWYRSGLEKYLVNNCDLSCCVSRPLQQKMQSYTLQPDRVRLSPNAFDPQFLSPNYQHQPTNNIRVGYFGHLTDKWFDWPSVIKIASSKPSWQFDLIGHAAPTEIKLPDNINMLGPKNHPQINEIAKHWNAAIIPFRIGRLADGVDPIKIYEYLALKLPVVSFRMPQIDDYPHTQTVNTVPEFVAALEKAVAQEWNAPLVDEFLTVHTWNNRAREFLTWTDQILAQPACEKLLYVNPNRVNTPSKDQAA